MSAEEWLQECQEHRRVIPTVGLLQKEFRYTPAVETDIAVTFKRIRQRQEAEKYARDENLPF